MASMEEITSIQKFYKNAQVFITGGTGFLGKILVEKLLRSTEVGTLYLLIREKKEKHYQDRIDDYFDDVIFNKLKEEKSEWQHRIRAVHGDLAAPSLDLSISDRDLLISKINIVIHLGATVKFNENLKTTFDINVNGTKYILDLAKEMKRLKSIVYVSTAYSNFPRAKIDETIYDPPISYEDLKMKLEQLSSDEVEKATPRIIENWPNTYSFTKCVAESLVKEVEAELPIAIFRPSIVISTYREPLEGWTNSHYGPTSIFAGILSGLVKVDLVNPLKVLDIVPVDMCIASLISSIWDVSTNESKQKSNAKIYNYVSGIENPLSIEEMAMLNILNARRNPTIHSMWNPSGIMVSNSYIFWFLTFIWHIVPGFIIDLCSVCTGNKPRMLGMYKLIYNATKLFTPFTFNNWEFSNNNVKSLWEKMEQRDKELFPFSIANVNWVKYCNVYMKGIRRYILKDPDSTLVSARRKNQSFGARDRVEIIGAPCTADGRFKNIGWPAVQRVASESLLRALRTVCDLCIVDVAIVSFYMDAQLY